MAGHRGGGGIDLCKSITALRAAHEAGSLSAIAMASSASMTEPPGPRHCSGASSISKSPLPRYPLFWRIPECSTKTGTSFAKLTLWASRRSWILELARTRSRAGTIEPGAGSREGIQESTGIGQGPGPCFCDLMFVAVPLIYQGNAPLYHANQAPPHQQVSTSAPGPAADDANGGPTSSRRCAAVALTRVCLRIFTDADAALCSTPASAATVRQPGEQSQGSWSGVTEPSVLCEY